MKMQIVPPPQATSDPYPRKDFRPDALQLMEADSTSLDIAVRWVAVTGTAGALTWYLGGYFFLAWAAFYVSANTAYLLSILYAPVVINRWWYGAMLTLNAITSWVFVAMPLYLLTLGEPSLEFAGVCGIIGLCLHNLVRHRSLHHVVICDIIVMTLCAGLAMWVFAQRAGTTAEQVVVLASACALASYFAVCFLSSVRVRSRLARAEELRGEAQKMEAVGRLTGGVAHDFNNILTVILGNLDLYGELSHPKERDNVVQEAYAAARRAASLTSQLLSFSRRATLMPETVNINQFLSVIGGMLQRVLPATITLEIVEGSRVLNCHADPNQLSTALLNLVINARDAMPDGGEITIVATKRRLPDADTPTRNDGRPLSGEFCDITVRDTGPGIPQELLTEVMTPFFTTKPLGKGSGLGLSMVVGFAEQTGGTLTLKNANGRGLAAILTLPTSEERE